MLLLDYKGEVLNLENTCVSFAGKIHPAYIPKGVSWKVIMDDQVAILESSTMKIMADYVGKKLYIEY